MNSLSFTKVWLICAIYTLFCLNDLKSQETCESFKNKIELNNIGNTYYSPKSNAINKITFYSLNVDNYQSYYFAVVTFKNSIQSYIYQVDSYSEFDYSLNYIKSAGKAFWKHIYPFKDVLGCSPTLSANSFLSDQRSISSQSKVRNETFHYEINNINEGHVDFDFKCSSEESTFSFKIVFHGKIIGPITYKAGNRYNLLRKNNLTFGDSNTNLGYRVNILSDDEFTFISITDNSTNNKSIISFNAYSDIYKIVNFISSYKECQKSFSYSKSYYEKTNNSH